MLFSEMPLIIILLTLYLRVSFISAQCRNDEVQDGNDCYYFNATNMDFNSAESVCQTRGQHLVSIHSQFGNQFLRNEGAKRFSNTDMFYIGFSSQDSADGKTFGWVDKYPADFTNWENGEPLSNQQCAYQSLKDAMWISCLCDNKLPFVCRGPAGVAPTEQTQSPSIGPQTCPGNWTYFAPTNMCYQMQIVQYDPDAEQQIVNCNGSVHTQVEDEFIRDIAIQFLDELKCFESKKKYVYWIGELKQKGFNCVWYNDEMFDYQLPYPRPGGWPCKDEDEISVFGVVTKSTKKIEWSDPDNEDWWGIPDKCKSIMCKVKPT